MVVTLIPVQCDRFGVKVNTIFSFFHFDVGLRPHLQFYLLHTIIDHLSDHLVLESYFNY